MPTCALYTNREIRLLKEGGKILRGCLDALPAHVHPGVTTAELDRFAEQYIRSHSGAEPAFKGYQDFPATLCTSVNDQCVHGIPGDRILEEGDIISLDCGVLFGGLYTDACITVAVGNVDEQSQNLMRATEEALQRAVAMLKAGVRVGDVSAAIEECAEEYGCSPVESLTGHGVGHHLHDFPDIPNLGSRGTGPVLPAGTVVAIEPILSLGAGRVRQESDGWTLSTIDGSRTAHTEHTLLIREHDCKIIA